jgi:Zn-dependent peptidase ImmA (M78 family)
MLGLQKSNMFLLKHFDGTFPVNISKMMYYEGIISDHSEDLHKTVASINPAIFSLKISKSIPKNIENFVMAYCLGSLFIENKEKEITLKDLAYSKTDNLHNECLIFGMNLVMPELKFKFYYRNVSKDKIVLAEKFNVSTYLIDTRIKQLRLQ